MSWFWDRTCILDQRSGIFLRLMMWCLGRSIGLLFVIFIRGGVCIIWGWSRLFCGFREKKIELNEFFIDKTYIGLSQIASLIPPSKVHPKNRLATHRLQHHLLQKRSPQLPPTPSQLPIHPRQTHRLRSTILPNLDLEKPRSIWRINKKYKKHLQQHLFRPLLPLLIYWPKKIHFQRIEPQNL